MKPFELLLVSVFIFLFPTQAFLIRPHHMPPKSPLEPSLVLFAKTKKKKKSPGGNTISVNRIAYRNYEVLDTRKCSLQMSLYAILAPCSHNILILWTGSGSWDQSQGD